MYTTHEDKCYLWFFVCVRVCLWKKQILFQAIKIGLKGILLSVSGMLANVYSWLCREGEEVELGVEIKLQFMFANLCSVNVLLCQFQATSLMWLNTDLERDMYNWLLQAHKDQLSNITLFFQSVKCCYDKMMPGTLPPSFVSRGWKIISPLKL